MTERTFAVISGGGTGGHVFEALAIARALVARGHDPATIELVGSRRGQEAVLLAQEAFPVTLLPGRGIVRSMGRPGIAANVAALLGLLRATSMALVRMSRHRPRVVVSVGGYASFPSDVAAVVLGIPLVLVTIDAVPGLVHRLLGSRAAANAIAFEGTSLPRSVLTGVAVRPEIASARRSPKSMAAARVDLGLPQDRAVVAVTGGSLGARRINDAVSELSRRWAARTDRAIYHVTGRRDWKEIRREVDDSTGPAGLWYCAVEFEDRMDVLYQAADLMVCRAGAGTVAELTAIGVPSVLVPLPGAPGDHQTANARALAHAGAAVVLRDEDCAAERLVALLDDLLEDGQQLCAMQAAAQSLGRPDAADRVAEVVEAHAR